MAMPGNTAATFLVHFFGSGLSDEKYVVKRFMARADGDIRPAVVHQVRQGACGTGPPPVRAVRRETSRGRPGALLRNL